MWNTDYKAHKTEAVLIRTRIACSLYKIYCLAIFVSFMKRIRIRYSKVGNPALQSMDSNSLVCILIIISLVCFRSQQLLYAIGINSIRFSIKICVERELIALLQRTKKEFINHEEKWAVRVRVHFDYWKLFQIE